MMSAPNGDDDTIVLEGKVERWRLKCPVDHRGVNVHPRTDHWYCRSCQKKGIDPEYSYVRDTKTGRFLEPDEVEIREATPPRLAETTDD